MTRVALYPGTPLADGRRRMVGRGFWAPSPTAEGVLTATSTRAGATATADAAAHTKGLWTEVVAATTTEVNLLTVTLNAATNAGAVNTSTLLDVGIGAAGAEVALVPNLAVGYRLVGDRYDIPVTIPAGSRLSVRCQSALGAQTVPVILVLGKLPFGRRPANHVLAFGVNLTTSRGVALTTGSANTKTGWFEITSSTTEPLGGLLIGEQGNGDTVFNVATALLDIGVGASGSEVVIIGDLSYSANNSESWRPHGDRNYPVDIPMGVRLAARWAVADTANSMDLILHGLPRQ